MEPPKLFRDLVKAGSALEEDARSALEASAAAKSSVEQRINRVRENFHMQRPARIEDIAALQKKVDSLSRKVDKLAKILAAQGLSDKPPVKRATAARKAVKAKSAAKTPRKKAAIGRRKNT
jgi:polyhydroxyalkanoate synthesis regulator phasin